uniref:Chitin-binding type-2 domain-containing protein n=2 Tax=Anopheles funestus TaxID=62324 RepID=A0A4Y0BPG5_ANOFN
MYIMCENRQYIRTETCPAGLHFNPTLSVCDSPDQAECLDFVCRNNPEGNQVTLESQNSCQLYFICIGNITVERRCAPGTIYEAENGWCVVDDAENPCERERLPAPPESVILQCTGENELDKIPHPTMCDVYYRCINGNLWVRQCPPGLLFDPDREQCNLADMVSCVEAQQSVKYKQ